MNDDRCRDRTPWTSLVLAALLLGLSAAPLAAQRLELVQAVELYWKASFDRTISILRKLDPAALSPGERALLHQYLGLSLFAKNKKDEAQEEFTKLLEFDPDYAFAGEYPSRALELFAKSKQVQAAKVAAQGVTAYEAGNFPEAVERFDLALRLDSRQPIAREFRKLAVERRDAERAEQASRVPPCEPSLVWAELDAKDATCDGKDYSLAFFLPAPVNRLTVIYAKHHFGVGDCWRIVLYDEEGQQIATVGDPGRAFAGETEPPNSKRWQVIDLPEVRTVRRIEMHAAGGHDLQRHLRRRVGKESEDRFILGLEVACER